ncbi:hypothetical protein J6590_038577 [Homalodisca vitripennis]|nr:hypothetical protein J6590_038577 [Homalodisca vitripennis]
MLLEPGLAQVFVVALHNRHIRQLVRLHGFPQRMASLAASLVLGLVYRAHSLIYTLTYKSDTVWAALHAHSFSKTLPHKRYTTGVLA